MIWTAGLALLSSIVFVAPGHAADPSGVWLTQEQDAHIRMAKCGRAYCGSIVWLRDGKDPQTGRPVTDEKNPDPARRGKPLLGTMIAINFEPADAPNKWQGRFYNADDGRLYDGTISLAAANELAAQGCMGPLCQTQTWTRVKR